MQTQQRKIPMRGVNGTFKHWNEMLPVFENELNIFRHKIDSLKSKDPQTIAHRSLLKRSATTLLLSKNNWYAVNSSTQFFSDTSFNLISFADELKELNGVQFSFREQVRNGTEIKFSNTEPVKVLIGYFNPQRTAFLKDSVFLKPPELETNATANDYGQAEVKIANAIVIKGLPPVNVHSYSFPPGNNNVLKLGKGACLVIGFVEGSQEIKPYDAGLTEAGVKKEIDWLFE
jgi:hypothetical protein